MAADQRKVCSRVNLFAVKLVPRACRVTFLAGRAQLPEVDVLVAGDAVLLNPRKILDRVTQDTRGTLVGPVEREAGRVVIELDLTEGDGQVTRLALALQFLVGILDRRRILSGPRWSNEPHQRNR